MKRSSAITSFPQSFQTQKIQVDGATIHVRAGGKGPAVVMLHGFGDTGDMWAPVAAVLIHNHTVVVPDLRGMGLSSHPEVGYDKKTQARDIAQVMDKLNIDKADFVTHDIGNMVGYASPRNSPRA
jgi:pimeloyl-ACP methyl ester carboxylesterase